jgi:hypothetical protein
MNSMQDMSASNTQSNTKTEMSSAGGFSGCCVDKKVLSSRRLGSAKCVCYHQPPAALKPIAQHALGQNKSPASRNSHAPQQAATVMNMNTYQFPQSEEMITTQ